LEAPGISAPLISQADHEAEEVQGKVFKEPPPSSQDCWTGAYLGSELVGMASIVNESATSRRTRRVTTSLLSSWLRLKSCRLLVDWAMNAALVLN
jgi:hypothetical protein